jgi:hypothetical protein
LIRIFLYKNLKEGKREKDKEYKWPDQPALKSGGTMTIPENIIIYFKFLY